MGGKFIDLTGQKFGKLTVVSLHGRINRITYWLCECDCKDKTKKTINGADLKRGKTKSCGCVHIERMTSHGMARTRIYKIYKGMKNRCYNIKSDDYDKYGGRGIIICEDWLGEEDGFVSFYNWAINNRYSDDLTIDRIEVDGNYEPSNCRWSTPIEQCNNKRTNRPITINGEIKNLNEWAREYNINPQTFHYRVEAGWKGEDLLRSVDNKQ